MSERSQRWLLSVLGAAFTGFAVSQVVRLRYPNTSVFELSIGGSVYAAIAFIFS